MVLSRAALDSLAIVASTLQLIKERMPIKPGTQVQRGIIMMALGTLKDTLVQPDDFKLPA
jgi:hypothetical protein